MSLARAFTTRRAKQQSTDMGVLPQRSSTVARGRSQSASIRTKISSPMELTHTTNMLVYNAPDLQPKSASSTASSKSVSDDDESGSARTSTSSPPTSPDIPSVADRSMSPEPNHLSCYFTVPGQVLPSITDDAPAPAIPKRAPSHVKKLSYDQPPSKFSRFSSSTASTHTSSMSLSRSASIATAVSSLSSGSLSRKRSTPSMPITPALASPPPVTRSNPSFRRTLERSDSQHPFGPELAQVSELAEDFGVKEKLNIIDEEEQELIARGLCSFRPEDYLSEISGLFSTFFRPERPAKTQEPIWI